MKKIFLIIFGLIVNLSQINSQSYHPKLRFQNVNPVWQHISFDSKSIGETVNGMNCLNFSFSVSDNNSLYVNFLNGFGGDYVFLEKINTITGDLDWNSSIGKHNSPVFEDPSKGYINEDGNYELLAFRRHDSKLSYNYGFNSFARIIYDSNEGQILNHIYPEEYDSLAPALTYSSIFFRTNSFLFPLRDNKYLYVSTEKQMNPLDTFAYNPDTMNLFSYILDTIGHKVEENVRLIKKKYELNHFYNFHSINQDTVWTIFHNFNTRDSSCDTFKQDCYFMVFDKKMNTIADKKMDSLDLANYIFSRIIYQDKDLFVFEVGKSKESILYFFDYKGNLLQKVPISVEGKRIDNNKLLKLKDGNFLLCGSSRNSKIANINNYLYFVKIDLSGKTEFLKKIKIIPKNNFFVTQFMHLLENGNVIIGGKHQYYIFSSSGNRLSDYFGDGNTTVTLCFKPSDIGMITSVSETEKESDMFIIYPNPAAHNITIEMRNNITGYIEISDVFGKKVLRQKIENTDQKTLDISYFPAGMYFINIINKNNRKQCKTVRFMKE